MTLVNLEHEAPLPLLMHILIATVQIKVDKTFTCLTGKKTTRSGVREIFARHHGSPIEGPLKTLHTSLLYGIEGFKGSPNCAPLCLEAQAIRTIFPVWYMCMQRYWFLFPDKKKETSTDLKTNIMLSGWNKFETFWYNQIKLNPARNRTQFPCERNHRIML